MSPVDCCVTYEIRCGACTEVHTCSYLVHVAESVPMPVVPSGWSEVGGRVYCPKHIVQVEYKVYPA